MQLVTHPWPTVVWQPVLLLRSALFGGLSYGLLNQVE